MYSFSQCHNCKFVVDSKLTSWTKNDSHLIRINLSCFADFKAYPLSNKNSYVVKCPSCSTTLGMMDLREPSVIVLDQRRCTTLIQNGCDFRLEVEEELQFNIVASKVEDSFKAITG